MIMIYVMPTEEELPPRALITDTSQELPYAVVWNGSEWTLDGQPLIDEIDRAITEHAKALGVELE